MNDALPQTPEAEVSPKRPELKPPATASAPENFTEVPERSSKPPASFLETVYYWVIARG